MGSPARRAPEIAGPPLHPPSCSCSSPSFRSPLGDRLHLPDVRVRNLLGPCCRVLRRRRTRKAANHPKRREAPLVGPPPSRARCGALVVLAAGRMVSRSGGIVSCFAATVTLPRWRGAADGARRCTSCGQPGRLASGGVLAIHAPRARRGPDGPAEGRTQLKRRVAPRSWAR